MSDRPEQIRVDEPINDHPPPSLICPFCGNLTSTGATCTHCKGRLDPLSRQATQNKMGPWFIRDETHPFRPGCDYATVRKLIAAGRITTQTIIRGPSTRQFWARARHAPTIANLLGECHNCHVRVSVSELCCKSCGADFTPVTDRENLGLAPVHLLPGQADPRTIAESTLRSTHKSPKPQASTQPTPQSTPPKVERTQPKEQNQSEPKANLDKAKRSSSSSKIAWTIAVFATLTALGLSWLQLQPVIFPPTSLADSKSSLPEDPGLIPEQQALNPADDPQQSTQEASAPIFDNNMQNPAKSGDAAADKQSSSTPTLPDWLVFARQQLNLGTKSSLSLLISKLDSLNLASDDPFNSQLLACKNAAENRLKKFHLSALP